MFAESRRCTPIVYCCVFGNRARDAGTGTDTDALPCCDSRDSGINAGNAVLTMPVTRASLA